MVRSARFWQLGRLVAVAIAAGMFASLTGAAGAAAPQQYRSEKFVIGIEGVQTVKWSTDGTGSPEDRQSCSGAETVGEGTETVRFRTSRGTRKTFSGLSSGGSPLSMTPYEGDLDTRGTIDRRGMTTTESYWNCEASRPLRETFVDGPGGCGRKTFNLLPIGMAFHFNKGFYLFGSDLTPLDPYRDCPSYGGFPAVLTGGDDGLFFAKLPRSDLLDRDLGKIVVLSGGSQTYENRTDGYTYSKTTIQWALSFCRLPNQACSNQAGDKIKILTPKKPVKVKNDSAPVELFPLCSFCPDAGGDWELDLLTPLVASATRASARRNVVIGSAKGKFTHGSQVVKVKLNKTGRAALKRKQRLPVRALLRFREDGKKRSYSTGLTLKR